MKQPAVHVVGAGVIGLSLAYELLRRGREVRIHDPAPCSGAGYVASAGMLAPISEAEIHDTPVVSFGIDSLERYPGFVAGVEEIAGRSCAFRQEGTLWVAADRDDAGDLEHLAETLRGKSLEFEPLDVEALLELEPRLSGRVQSGLRLRSDHQIDPRGLCRALHGAVERLGGIIESRRVSEVREHAGRVRGVAVLDEAGQEQLIEAEKVVVCAGVATGRGVRLPIPDIGIRPVKGQILRLRGESLLRHVVRTPKVYLVPRGENELLLGATQEEMDDLIPTAGAVLDLLRHGWNVLPGIYDVELAEISVGLRPAAGDHEPVIGRTGVEGLYLSTGHYRSGVLLAPASAHYLAELIETDRLPPALEPFSPRRLWRR
ncbi:hypothetical protein ABI59_03700 [Acidobacteria bacterium Mor1]|nr:hypothetical protein ABI59_03700 [Acidobacteria bacterium Mor1]